MNLIGLIEYNSSIAIINTITYSYSRVASDGHAHGLLTPLTSSICVVHSLIQILLHRNLNLECVYCENGLFKHKTLQYLHLHLPAVLCLFVTFFV